MDLLKANLLPQLHYHRAEHTEKEVVYWAQRLAEMEGLRGKERELLITAAYFHDVGWTKVKACTQEEYARRLVHEELGAEMAQEALQQFGFGQKDIDAVRELILATRLDSTPKNLSEKILRDADLSSIGQGVEIFWKRGNDLRHEMSEFGVLVDDESWMQIEYNLLEGLVYFTESARRMFDANKANALASVKAILS